MVELFINTLLLNVNVGALDALRADDPNKAPLLEAFKLTVLK